MRPRRTLLYAAAATGAAAAPGTTQPGAAVRMDPDPPVERPHRTRPGGLDGDFHRVRLTLPGWPSLAPGATAQVQLAYQLPIAGPSNVTVTIGGDWTDLGPC